ncbi:MAG: class I SAM-dependent methyltransferase [Tahibacter sp.]
MSILDVHVKELPAAQNSIDLFAGQWSSILPSTSGLVAAPGTAALFDDGRLDWAIKLFGGVDGLDILELGPLEAGHTYMLHQAGAKAITAIESNSRAFLKCLCIKEVFGLPRARFLLGDFIAYLRQRKHKFDLVVASGVLYHMTDPLELIELMAAASDKVYIWTHYYDPSLIQNNPLQSKKFGRPHRIERKGVSYEVALQSYLDALKWNGFTGGGAETSLWLTRDSLLEALRVVGFDEVTVAFEQPDHQHGPALALCARRSAA